MNKEELFPNDSFPPDKVCVTGLGTKESYMSQGCIKGENLGVTKVVPVALFDTLSLEVGPSLTFNICKAETKVNHIFGHYHITNRYRVN